MSARRGWMVVLASVAALMLVWRFLPAGSPPIYDGQCIADPYAVLGGSPAPQAADKTFPAAGTFPAAEVLTGETPPQAQILMEAGTFDNSTAVTVSIAPVAAPTVKPPNGTIEGNVYRFSARNASGGELEPASPSLAVFIILRGLTSSPAPTIDGFNGTSWTPLSTLNAGCGNTFEVTSTQLGEFAAVRPGGGGGTTPAASGGIPGVAIIGGLAVLLIIVVAVLFSLDRRRGAAR
ncbi:MAG: hypothetical protein ACYDCS_12985 [Candidatus Dormibacteria bacterium]